MILLLLALFGITVSFPEFPPTNTTGIYKRRYDDDICSQNEYYDPWLIYPAARCFQNEQGNMKGYYLQEDSITANNKLYVLSGPTCDTFVENITNITCVEQYVWMNHSSWRWGSGMKNMTLDESAGQLLTYYYNDCVEGNWSWREYTKWTNGTAWQKCHKYDSTRYRIISPCEYVGRSRWEMNVKFFSDPECQEVVKREGGQLNKKCLDFSPDIENLKIQYECVTKSRYVSQACTALFGMMDTPHEMDIYALRTVRDNFMMKYAVTRKIVNLYYLWSPVIVELAKTSKIVLWGVRMLVYPVVWIARNAYN